MQLGLGTGIVWGGAPSAYLKPDLEWLSTTGVTGSPVTQWDAATGSGSLTAATTARPTISAGAFGASQGIHFDGSANVIKATSKLVSATSAGTLAIAFKTGATFSSAQVLVAQADSAAANKWWEIGITSDKRIYVEYNNAGTKHTVIGTTILDPSTVYHLMLAYDGTDFYLEVNGVEQNPLTISNVGTFAWIGAITGTVHFSIGAASISGGATRFFLGDIAGVWFWNTDITA